MNTLSRKQGWMLHGALLTVAIVFPLVFSSPFWVNFGVLALFYAFIGQSWNIAGGFAGQLSFGHVVFFGAGAYASTILQIRFGFNPWWGLPASAVAGGVVGFVIAFLSFRAGLKGSYFALITLAFAEVLRIVANSVDITGGGLGVLKPETSTATTAGIVFTPSWANFTASVDYFEIDVRDQISQLGAGAIVGSCYSLPNFPNAFCDLFNRAGTGANPLNIEFVRDSYLNINKQLVRGYDLNLRWDGDFNFGKVEVESQFTYTMENVEQLFDSSLESGFDSNDYVGLVSYPKLVGNIRSSLTRGDFTYTWGMRYVDETENFNFTQPAAYFGNPNPVYDTVAEDRL